MAKRRARKKPTGRRQSDGVGQQVVGYTLILVAFAAAMVNVADIVADLKEWHGATSPSFVGPLMKQIGSTLVAAIGGKLLPNYRSLS